MSGGSFDAHADSISSGGSAFGAQSKPILVQSGRLENLRGSAGSTGRAYVAQGAAYHDAVSTQLSAIVDDFARKCDWVRSNLKANAAGYDSRDADNRNALRTSASGMG